MLGETPMVDQRRPAASALSIMTRVVAAVPPAESRIRTLKSTSSRSSMAREYLPRMYGAVNYTLIDDVGRLPLKVADVYRRLTS